MLRTRAAVASALMGLGALLGIRDAVDGTQLLVRNEHGAIGHLQHVSGAAPEAVVAVVLEAGHERCDFRNNPERFRIR